MSSRLVPFHGSILRNVREAFDEIGLSEDDVIYDLGCGDGRVLLMAMVEYNVKKAVGVEIRKHLVDKQLFEHERFELLVEDLHTTDFSDATVIYLYLRDDYNLRLRRKLSKMKDTKIVSCWFPIEGWIPDKVIELNQDAFYIYYGGQT